MNATVSIVTPTFMRPREVKELLENFAEQTLRPYEVVLVDGAPNVDVETENLVASISARLPFECRYLRHQRGTAIQRNAGINAARGDLVALIDDDVRLEPDFLQVLVSVFAGDLGKRVGGVVGYRTNMHFDIESRTRWKWYRRLSLLTTYEPGRYDFRSGYPINAGLQAPFSGVRRVDFMTTACAMWRREVFDVGLRFDPFFCDYGVLEDAHFSLRAGRSWDLLQCGDARCVELHSPAGRVDRRKLGYKTVVNYYYVFRDISQPLTWRQKTRFWSFQLFELFRIGTSAMRRRRASDVDEVLGRIAGFKAVALGKIKGIGSSSGA